MFPLIKNCKRFAVLARCESDIIVEKSYMGDKIYSDYFKNFMVLLVTQFGKLASFL